MLSDEPDSEDASVLLSIVVPTYNRVDLLRLTVASVIAQNHDDYELLIVDDASDDATWEYLQTLDGVRVYRNPTRRGLASNWNRAISLSKGQYVLVLQDDDLAQPDLVRTLAAEAGPDLICSATRFIDGEGEDLGMYWQSNRRLLDPPTALIEYAAAVPFSATQTMFRRDVFDRLGGMDETLPIGSDAEMIMRWMLTCTTLHIPDVLTLRRRWNGSTSAEVEPTVAMSETMRAVVQNVLARAENKLSVEDLADLRESLHRSFWVPYVHDA